MDVHCSDLCNRHDDDNEVWCLQCIIMSCMISYIYKVRVILKQLISCNKFYSNYKLKLQILVVYKMGVLVRRLLRMRLLLSSPFTFGCLTAWNLQKHYYNLAFLPLLFSLQPYSMFLPSPHSLTYPPPQP